MTPPRFTIVKEKAATPTDTGRPRLLVAEDDPALRRILVRQLSSYDVVEARDGVEAFALALLHEPDVILADWMMPECDGLELTRRLRDEAVTSLTPIVLLTGRNDESSRREALEVGVNDFVGKPFSFLELQHRIRGMMALRRAQQEVEESRQLLARSERLSSLGELSAGIMHEINNPLNYAVTGVHALKMISHSLPRDLKDEFDEMVGDIGEGLSRVSEIATDLRNFAKMGCVEKKRVNLSRVLRMSERLLADRLLGVQYEAEVSEDLFVHVNEGQISQILINLIANAVDALETSARGSEAKIIRVTAEETPQGVYLAVWDNGSGIDLATQSRLFEPFFSTKAAGRGMGLGLSVCQRMLEAHDAELVVDSVEGAYTRFYTVLPLAADQSVEHAPQALGKRF